MCFCYFSCLCSTTGCGHDPGAKDDSPKHGEDSNLREKKSFHGHGMRKKCLQFDDEKIVESIS